MFNPNANNKDRGLHNWHRPVNPNAHTYVAGYGFSPRPPFLMEQKLIARFSATVSLCLIGFLFFSSFLTQFCIELLNILLPFPLYTMMAQHIMQLSLAVGSIGALTIPFLLYGLYTHIPFHSAIPLRRVSAKLITAAVMLSCAISVIGIYVSEAFACFFSFFNIFFYEPILALPSGIIGTMLYLLNMTVIPAVFEEIAFRGVIMQSLRRFGDGFALLISACLFAMVHISPLSMPHAFLMGLIIGYFVLFTGSLHIGMIIHLVHNTLSLLVSQLGNLSHGVANIIFLAIQLIYMALGAFAVLWLLRHYDNIFVLKHSNTINRASQKLRCFFCTLPFALLLIIILLQAGAYLIW
ncbi:MAG: lysostaphin resistance A-like protein [Candidatus Fimivivens sp.]